MVKTSVLYLCYDNYVVLSVLKKQQHSSIIYGNLNLLNNFKNKRSIEHYKSDTRWNVTQQYEGIVTDDKEGKTNAKCVDWATFFVFRILPLFFLISLKTVMEMEFLLLNFISL